MVTLARKDDTGTWYVLRLTDNYERGPLDGYITACYGPVNREEYGSYDPAQRERLTTLLDTTPGTDEAARWANTQPWNT